MMTKWKRDSAGAYISGCGCWYIWQGDDEDGWHLNYSPDEGETVYSHGTRARLKDAKREAEMLAYLRERAKTEASYTPEQFVVMNTR